MNPTSFFFRELNFTFLEIGVLFSIRALTATILEIPLGVAADVVGRRRSMIFSCGCYILSFLVFFFFSRFSVYIGAMVLFALGEALRTGTHKAMILDYLKGKGWEKWKEAFLGLATLTRNPEARRAFLSSALFDGFFKAEKD